MLAATKACGEEMYASAPAAETLICRAVFQSRAAGTDKARIGAFTARLEYFGWGRNYEYLARSRSILSLVPGGMVA